MTLAAHWQQIVESTQRRRLSLVKATGAIPERLRRMEKEDKMSAEHKQQDLDKSSHSETNEPWKKPGQTSQDGSQQPKGKKGSN